MSLSLSDAPSVNDILRKVLLKYWGYSHFHAHQLEICQSLITDKRDTFAVLATGSGKSLLYQLPPLALTEAGIKSTALVISPLVSLIFDQIESLEAKGISVGSLSKDTSPLNETKARRGDYRILYATPEKISCWRSGLAEMAENTNLCCIVIDECHMMSEWGHDFRESYRKLGQIRDWCAGYRPPILAVTATATTVIREDVLQSLNFSRNPLLIQGSIDRPNLKYFVSAKHDPADVNGILLFKYRHFTQIDPSRSVHYSTLIYTNTRQDCETLSKYINDSVIMGRAGIRSAYYHAGLTDEERRQIYHGFMSGAFPVVVATVAFGMGIDKPDIRLVINFGMPKSMEGYYQMTGRAGRDGLPAECILMFNRGDVNKCYAMITSGNRGVEQQQQQTREASRRIRDMVFYCKDLKSCRRKYILNYFECPQAFSPSIDSPHCCDLCDEAITMRQNVSQPLNTNNIPTQFDFGLEILLLLAAVKACGECFGLGVVLSILHGSHDKSVQRINGYSQFASFGRGQLQSKDWWKELSYCLVDDEKLLATERKFLTNGIAYERYFLTYTGHRFLDQYGHHLRHQEEQGQDTPISFYKIKSTKQLWNLLNPATKFRFNLQERHDFKSKEQGHVAMTTTDQVISHEEGTSSIQNSDTNVNITESSAMDGAYLDLGPEIFVLLKTILDCGEVFGLGLSTSIVVGRHDLSVQRVFEYESMDTFGRGKLQSMEWWKALGHQLVAEQLICAVPIQYAACSYSLSDQGRQFLIRHQYSSVSQISYLVKNPSPNLLHLARYNDQGGLSRQADSIEASTKFVAPLLTEIKNELSYDQQLKAILDSPACIQAVLPSKLYRPKYLQEIPVVQEDIHRDENRVYMNDAAPVDTNKRQKQCAVLEIINSDVKSEVAYQTLVDIKEQEQSVKEVAPTIIDGLVSNTDEALETSESLTRTSTITSTSSNSAGNNTNTNTNKGNKLAACKSVFKRLGGLNNFVKPKAKT